MLELIGRHAGVVRRVVAAVKAEHDPEDLHAFAAELCDTSAIGPERCVPHAAGGGRTPEAALAACLGEAAERYAAAMYDPDELEFGDVRDGDLSPLEVAPFSDAQRDRRGFPFARAGPLRWARGADDRRAPAFAVFLPYTPAPGEALPGPSLSTGLAAGPTLESAREAALLEVIERDAFANWWMRGEPAPRAAGGVDLTNDLGGPVAAVLIEADVVSVGAAAARSFEAAATKARLEAELGQIYVRALVRRGPAPREVTDFPGHARWFTDHPEHRSALRRMFADGPVREAPAGVVDPWDAVARRGLRPWWRDLTTRDLAGVGVHVARVLVPGLTPLHAIEAWPFLGAPRLCARNPLPHPLP